MARIDHSYVINIVARVHHLVAESGDGSLNEDKRESDLMALFLSENGSFFFLALLGLAAVMEMYDFS